MTRILTPCDRDYLTQAYREGATIQDLRQRFPISQTQFYRILREAHVVVRGSRKEVDAAALVSRYRAGESELALGLAFDVSRTLVRKRLSEAGVVPRGRSEANLQRMGQLTPQGRKDLTASANNAMRGRKATPGEQTQHAATYQDSLGYSTPDEMALMEWLEARGATCTAQLAVGAYNVDVAVHAPSIAVELRSRNAYPSNHRERSEYLFDQGWAICYVFASKRDFPLTEGAADYIAAWAQELSRDPSVRGQYRVIRGNGKPLASMERQF